MPQYAVISVGKVKNYDHPTEATLSRLRDADMTVFRTDINKDIIFTSDGKTVSVSTEKKTPTTNYEPETSYTTTKAFESEEQNNDVKGTDYIINRNTGKFHYTYCSSVKQMKESNKRFYTGNRDELVDEGYSPCGNCHL